MLYTILWIMNFSIYTVFHVSLYLLDFLAMKGGEKSQILELKQILI